LAIKGWKFIEGLAGSYFLPVTIVGQLAKDVRWFTYTQAYALAKLVEGKAAPEYLEVKIIHLAA
jgi:hypothetical protein